MRLFLFMYIISTGYKFIRSILPCPRQAAQFNFFNLSPRKTRGGSKFSIPLDDTICKGNILRNNNLSISPAKIPKTAPRFQPPILVQPLKVQIFNPTAAPGHLRPDGLAPGPRSARQSGAPRRRWQPPPEKKEPTAGSPARLQGKYRPRLPPGTIPGARPRYSSP